MTDTGKISPEVAAGIKQAIKEREAEGLGGDTVKTRFLVEKARLPDDRTQEKLHGNIASRRDTLGDYGRRVLWEKPGFDKRGRPRIVQFHATKGFRYLRPTQYE